MFFKTAFLLAALLPVYALTLPPSKDSLKSDALTSLTKSLPQSNISTPRISIDCDESYGEELNVEDCSEAVSYIRPSRDVFSLMDRDDPERTNDITPLPYRLMGRKAECYIQPVLKYGARRGRISRQALRTATEDLIRKCAFFRRKGGRAYNIGGDGNVEIQMGKYEPSVICTGSIREWPSCNACIYGMEASTQEQIFGHGEDPMAQVQLPAEIDADDGACKLRVFTSGSIDIATWYSLWEAATAIFSMCGRSGKGGYATQLGENGFLFESMSGPDTTNPGMRIANLTRLNTTSTPSISNA